MKGEKKEERDIVYQSVPMNFTIGEGEYKTEVEGYGWTFYNRATPWIRSAPSPIPDANHPILREGKEEKKERLPYNWKTFPQDCIQLIKIFLGFAWTIFVVFFWMAVVGIGVGSWL